MTAGGVRCEATFVLRVALTSARPVFVSKPPFKLQIGK